jgi:lysine N6-hydroxylase
MSELWRYLTHTGEPAERRRGTPSHVEEPLPLDVWPAPEREAPQLNRPRHEAPQRPGVLHLLGVGIGTANLALAALADGVEGLPVQLFDARPRFATPAPPDAASPVSFLADLVTLVEPANRWSFLSYLRAQHRMHPFYLDGRFHLPQREYDDYCRWVASAVPNCRFGTRVDAVSWAGDHFVVRTARTAHAIRDEVAGDGDGVRATYRARNLVLDLGADPQRPRFLRPLGDSIAWEEPGADHRVRTDPGIAGGLFLQRPGQDGIDVDAYRCAAILNQVAGREVFSDS